MPADGNSTFQPPIRLEGPGLVARTVRSWRIAFRTLFTTEDHCDAVSAGFDGPTEPGVDGGFAIHWDGRNPQFPSVTINGSDGQVEIVGYQAIREVANAFLAAEKMAASMAEVA